MKWCRTYHVSSLLLEIDQTKKCLEHKQKQHLLSECRQGLLLQINFCLASSNELFNDKWPLFWDHLLKIRRFWVFFNFEEDKFPKIPLQLYASGQFVWVGQVANFLKNLPKVLNFLLASFFLSSPKFSQDFLISYDFGGRALWHHSSAFLFWSRVSFYRVLLGLKLLKIASLIFIFFSILRKKQDILSSNKAKMTTKH